MIIQLLITVLCCMGITHASISYPVPVIYVDPSNGTAVNSSECWEGGVDKPPCLTFDLGLQGLHHYKLGTLLVAEGNYNCTLNDYTDFNGTDGPLNIQGVLPSSSLVPLVNVTCANGIGLAFTLVSNITITGIRFIGCGGLRTTTSLNENETHPAFYFYKIYVGIYFLFCRNLNISMIEVRDTPGTGMIIYNTVGYNIIHNSTFINNSYQVSGYYSGGGGLSIEFSYCDILIDNLTCVQTKYFHSTYTENAVYEIFESYFINNYANLSTTDTDSDSFLLPNKQYHVAMGRGGGLSLFFLGRANSNTITVTNCTITGNKAVWAGGLLVEYHDSAMNNVFVLDNTVVSNNMVYDLFKSKHHWRLLASGTGGGGARVAMFDFDDDSYIWNNNVTFIGCKFERNQAYYGGGVSFYTTITNISNSIEFDSCHFIENTARLGSGIDLSLFHMGVEGSKPTVKITDCEFTSNYVRYIPGSIIGAGTIYIDTITIVFAGLVSFYSNNGTAMTVTNAHIEVSSDCLMHFESNTGRYGGGLSLLGVSYVMTYSNSTFYFLNNSANLIGGAIYYYSSGERDLVGSGNCFIRYSNWSISRESWEVTFKFENNSANGEPNSIYATTVLPCVHGGEDWNISLGAEGVFCWNDNWLYNGSSNSTTCHSQIKTAAIRYHVNSSYTAIPGDMFNLNASVYDDYENLISGSTVFSLKLVKDAGNIVSFRPGNFTDHDVTSHGNVRLYGEPNSTVRIQIETLDPVVIRQEFKVTLSECPPGYHIPPNTSNSTTLAGCKCEDGNYNGYIQCKDDNFKALIVRSGWIGKVRNHSELLAGESPYIANISNDSFLQLPQDISKLNAFFCNQSHSNGTLCGSCIKDYGVSASAFEFINTPCVKCRKPAALYVLLYILAAFIPTLLFFCIVFIFSISVTSGPLNSFIFFAQIINTVAKITANGMISFTSHKGLKYVNTFYSFAYNFWNMKFLDSWLLDFCISPKLNSLDILLLGYARAIFPLILLICVFSIVYLYNRGVPFVVYLFRPLHRCLARFRQFSNLRKSIIGGIAVFIVISYTQITLISLMVLAPAKLVNSNGNVVERVFLYNGNYQYSWANYRYILPAIVAICVFIVAPPILFAYPSLLKLVSFLSCHRVNVSRLYPSPRLQALLNEFHGCYKDGSDGGNDCRWFASLYFILRVGLVSIYTTTNTWHLQYTEQIFLFLFVALLFATFRPYRNDWINNLDTAMFLLLASISTLSFYNLTSTWIGLPLNVSVVVIQQLIMGIPLVYCIGYCCTVIYNIKPCFKKSRSRIIKSIKAIDKTNPKHDADHDDEDFQHNDHVDEDHGSYTPTSMLDDSTHVKDFLDFVEDSGRYRTNTSGTRTTAQWTGGASNSNYTLPKNTNSSINTTNSSVNESTRLLDTPGTSESGRPGFVKSLLWFKKKSNSNQGGNTH